MSTAKQLTGVSVGVIRYSGKCTHELNKVSGEGKIIFDAPDHAAAWMQEQEHLHPHDFRAMNIYRCPYFTHYHLTTRPVHMVNGIIVEDGNHAGEATAKPAATSQPPARDYKWRLDDGRRNREAFTTAFKNGVGRQEIADKAGVAYDYVCRILRDAGLGGSSRNRKSEPTVRKLATSIEELDAQQAALEAQMRKLAEDRARIIELTRIKVEWAVEPVSIRVGKHNESLVLTIADWNTVLKGLRTLQLDGMQVEAKS
jgi:hypothetical protein